MSAVTGSPPTATPLARRRQRPQYLTSRGLLMFSSILLVAGSAFRWSRLSFAGLMVHPYLPPMIGVFFLVALPRLARFPASILRVMVFFFLSYSLATISGTPSGSAGEILKVGASVLTIITMALAIRTEPDYRAAVLALNIALVVMSLGALLRGASGGLAGINPLEQIANKNAYSMYALPAVLLGGSVVLDPRASRWLRVVLGGTVILISFAVFSTANRSGWAGIVLIGLMLVSRGRRIQSMVLVAVIAGGIYMFVGRQESTRNVLQHRYEQTVGRNYSDTMRRRLFFAALEIGLEHPLMGVGPTRLPYYLSDRLRNSMDGIDSHNVFGHLVGGCGFIITGIFLFGGLLMLRGPRRPPDTPEGREALALQRMMMALWVMRGMFSREILYNPSFAIGLGLTMALCMIHGLWGRAPSRLTTPTPAPVVRS
ncbi:MAG: O-antigen ligase family protein [Deltaproteobacteria bacterium]|nr:O-antigen ligase family protein [Deltaproteobacteria bacterium]